MSRAAMSFATPPCDTLNTTPTTPTAYSLRAFLFQGNDGGRFIT